MMFPEQPKTDPALLERLINAARNYKMTPQEHFEQRVSWVYGQISSGWTKDQVRSYLSNRDGAAS